MVREERVEIAINGTAEVAGLAVGTGIPVGDMGIGCIRGMNTRVSSVGTMPRPLSGASGTYIRHCLPIQYCIQVGM